MILYCSLVSISLILFVEGIVEGRKALGSGLEDSGKCNTTILDLHTNN